MKEVSIDATLPSGIGISFFKEKGVDDDATNKLLEDNKDKEMLKLIVRALQRQTAYKKE
jgi:hypothetical protein